MRIDKWLWCVRAFRTRTTATAACDDGSVTIADQPVKPSRELRAGEVVVVTDGPRRRLLRHKADPPARVGADRVPEFATDETPPEEKEAVKLTLAQRLLQRPRGAGRPTKKDRRALDEWLQEE